MNMFGDRFCYLGNVDLSSWQKHSSSGNMAGKDLCVNRGKLESISMLTSQDRPLPVHSADTESDRCCGT